MQKPLDCIGCDLYKISNGFSIPDGEGTNGVVIVGEGLGHEEFLDGMPFRPKAQSGSKLEECFRLLNSPDFPVSRQQFKLWNLIACQPPGNKLNGMWYESGAIKHCERYFNKEVGDYVAPLGYKRVILALGNLPLKHLTGVSGLEYEKQNTKYLRGYVLQGRYGLVVNSYHPSFIKRGNPHLTSLLVEDIRKAILTARQGFVDYPFHKSYRHPKYNVNPSLDEAISFFYRCKDNQNLTIAYDIETPDTDLDEDEREDLEKTDIVQIQFSLGKGEGIAFPFRDKFINVAKGILKLFNNKANHNTWNFDDPRLRKAGLEVRGRIDDTMVMFKRYQNSLPAHLQGVASFAGFPFPWKHLFGSDLAFYGCADVDAVQYILEWLPERMKEIGCWKSYEDYVRPVHEVLDDASKRGFPVNNEKRLEIRDKFVEIQKEKDLFLQQNTPLEIRNLSPRRKDKETGFVEFGYKKEPKEIEEDRKIYQQRKLGFLEDGIDESKIISFEDYVYKKRGMQLREFLDYDDNLVKRWCRVLEFKSSSQQVLKYLKWKIKVLGESENKEDRKKAKEYYIPTDSKGEKETTNKDELKELAEVTGDEILSTVTEIRSLDTVIGNYIPNWEPDKDGRVHTEWGFKAPTFQIDSRRPNVLNVSKHTETGQILRRMLECPEGYCFIEADKKSFHVATMGFRANSKNYLRFSQLDPHSIFTSFLLRAKGNKDCPEIEWGMEDGDILERCKFIKKNWGEIRQKQSKPCVLGNQLGLGSRKLYHQNRKYFESEKEAKYYQNVLAEIFPEVEIAKNDIKELAHLQTFLLNEFGFLQYFYDVFSWGWNKRINRWEKRNGGDAEKVLGFAVQSPAFGMILGYELLKFRKRGDTERFNFLKSVHDSLVFMPKLEDKDKCLESIVEIMNSPCEILKNESTGEKGLVVKVEVSMGRNLAKFDSLGNNEGMQEIKI